MQRAGAAGRSARRACAVAGLAWSPHHDVARRAPDTAVRERLPTLASERVRWGYRRLPVVLQREGHVVNHQRVFRLYREEHLQVRHRRRKRVAVPRRPMVPPTHVNECWAADFVSDALTTGRRVRIFNVVDTLTRKNLACAADTRLPAARVIEILETIALERGAYPQRLTVDNGSELRSRALDQWAYEHGVDLAFLQPGQPMQNAYAERFNGRMRDELLNTQW